MALTYGYALSSEEHPPSDLVRNAGLAEEAGFEFIGISDHFHPWLHEQGHSPFVWSVLGGIAATTGRIRVGTGVTAPILRIHPAIVAHAVATTACMFERPGRPGRFFFGVGTGEALNEHVLGDKWPIPEERLERLEEAVTLMRRLWQGGNVDFRGRYYTVENAQLFDLPSQVPEVIVSAFGPKATRLAAEIGDGYWGTSPQKELLDLYAEAGGQGPRYGQLTGCWAPDEASARQTMFRVWKQKGAAGQLSQDLPTPTHFEQASQSATEEEVVGSAPVGPDVERWLETVRAYADAGYTHLYFHQVGPDQEGFVRFWREELAPKLP